MRSLYLELLIASISVSMYRPLSWPVFEAWSHKGGQSDGAIRRRARAPRCQGRRVSFPLRSAMTAEPTRAMLALKCVACNHLPRQNTRACPVFSEKDLVADERGGRAPKVPRATEPVRMVEPSPATLTSASLDKHYPKRSASKPELYQGGPAITPGYKSSFFWAPTTCSYRAHTTYALGTRPASAPPIAPRHILPGLFDREERLGRLASDPMAAFDEISAPASSPVFVIGLFLIPGRGSPVQTVCPSVCRRPPQPQPTGTYSIHTLPSARSPRSPYAPDRHWALP